MFSPLTRLMQLNCKTQEESQIIVKGAFFLIFLILTGTLSFISYIKAVDGLQAEGPGSKNHWNTKI